MLKLLHTQCPGCTLVLSEPDALLHVETQLCCKETGLSLKHIAFVIVDETLH